MLIASGERGPEGVFIQPGTPGLCAVTHRLHDRRHDPILRRKNLERMHMYMGGGILGTILIVVLIIWLVRRV